MPITSGLKEFLSVVEVLLWVLNRVDILENASRQPFLLTPVKGNRFRGKRLCMAKLLLDGLGYQ